MCIRDRAKALHVVGLVNVQYVVYQDTVYVIEVNPRSSRTVPYISKVTNVPMVELATRCMLGEPLKAVSYTHLHIPAERGGNCDPHHPFPHGYQ